MIIKEKVTSYITMWPNLGDLSLVVDKNIDFRSRIHGFRFSFDLFLAICSYLLYEAVFSLIE